MLIKGETLSLFPLMLHHLQVAVAAGFPEFVSLTRELLHLFHGKDEMHFQILDHPQKLDHEELLSAKEKPRPRSRQAKIATNFRTKIIWFELCSRQTKRTDSRGGDSQEQGQGT